MKETPRTNFAAYEKHKNEIEDWSNQEEVDGVRWCNLLNECRKLEIELQEAKEDAEYAWSRVSC